MKLNILKNTIKNTIKNTQLHKNLFLIILIIGIIGTLYYQSTNTITEPWLNPTSQLNLSMTAFPITKATFESKSISTGINKYTCPSNNNLYFYTRQTSPFSIYDPSTITANTSVECDLSAHSLNYDFYTFNNNNTCSLYKFTDTNYNDASNTLYFQCVSGSRPDYTDYSLNKLTGKGYFTAAGYDKLFDSNIDAGKYITSINTYSLKNESIQNILHDIKSNINNISSESNIDRKFGLMNTLSGEISSYLHSLENDFSNLWIHMPQYITGDKPEHQKYQQFYGDSSYIMQFIDKIGASEIATKIIGDLSYNTTLGEFEDTKLDYKSNFLISIFLTLVVVIAIILVILSVTNPDIISAELIIGFVILIAAIVFFGTKYFNFFKQDVDRYSHINY